MSARKPRPCLSQSLRIQPWSSLHTDVSTPQQHLDPELLSPRPAMAAFARALPMPRAASSPARGRSPPLTAEAATPTVQCDFESSAADNIRRVVQHMNPVSLLSPPATRAPRGLQEQHPALYRLFRAYVLAYELELPPADLARFVQSSQLVPELYSSVADLAGVLDNLVASDQHALVDFMEFTVWLIDGVQHSAGGPIDSEISHLPLPAPSTHVCRGGHCRWLGGLALVQAVIGKLSQLRLLLVRWSVRAGRDCRAMASLKSIVSSCWHLWAREAFWWVWNRWEAAMAQFREVRLIVEMEKSRLAWEKKIVDVEDDLAVLLLNECR